MTDNDLILRMLLDVETKEALKKINNFGSEINSKLGKTFSQVKTSSGDAFKDIFKPFEGKGNTDKIKLYQAVVKDMDNVVKSIIEVDRKTNKIKRIRALDVLTPQKFATEFGLDYLSYQAIQNQENNPNQRGSFLGKIFDSKIFKRVKSYGLLRIIRSTFVAIERGLSQSIAQLAVIDKNVNKTMSSIKNSSEKISASLTLSMMPILETLAPIFEDIANAVSSVANGISQANAKAKGLSSYTKISDKYMKDYASSVKSSLLSFDKFESLNAKQSPFEEASVPETLSSSEQLGQTLFKVFGLVLDIIGKIWNLISPIVSAVSQLLQPVLELVDILLDELAPIIEHIFAFLEPLILTIGDAVGAVVALIRGDFDSLGEYLKDFFVNIGKSIVNLLFGIWNNFVDLFQDSMNGIIEIVNALLKPIDWLAEAFGGDITIKPMDIQHWKAKYFADGGIAKNGDLFIANERGPELVYSGPNNSSSIMNIQQFKQAMVEALYEASDVFQSQGGEVVLNLDGAEIARSKRFTNEINRKNAGINLR